jgi:4'-phosphopantetheinyl transferase
VLKPDHATIRPLIWSADQRLQHLDEHWPLQDSSDRPLAILADLKAQVVEPGAETSLSSAERNRLQGLSRTMDRERYLARTALLRTILGLILKREASTIEFGAGSHGKPELLGGRHVHFNISHSGDWLLMGFHPSQAVGVDVQRIDSAMNWRPIAERCFARPVIDSILKRPKEEQHQHFIQAWCELEALLKCRGQGLSGLGQPGAPGLANEERLWTVLAPEGYRAAIAQSAPQFSGQTGTSQAPGRG